MDFAWSLRLRLERLEESINFQKFVEPSNVDLLEEGSINLGMEEVLNLDLEFLVQIPEYWQLGQESLELWCLESQD